MTLLQVIFLSWQCILFGQCAEGFERDACRFEQLEDSIVVPNCFVLPYTEIQAIQDEPADEQEEEPKPKSRRTPRSRRR